MSAELRMEKKTMRIAPLGEESCVPDLSGEVVLQNQLRFSLGEEDEIYEGYGRVKNAYPYRQRNGYTRVLQEEEVQTAVLENEFIKAVFLPEYGGRLWELWDKEKNENLLYTNDVLRFSNLAVRNAWFSGGVEWNLGVIGHTPFTTEQMYVAQLKNKEGNPVLRMYEYERIRDVTYQMDFWLDDDSRFLNCRMRIVNEKKEVVPMYWWSNMAVPEFEGGRVIVPANSAYTSVKNEVYKVDIPVVNGVDITDYKKIPKSIDYFFELSDDAPRYIANVNREGYGLLQKSTGRLKSRKLFSWGNQGASDHWQEFLTEDAGRYLEIQAGLGKTQYGCIPMAPHTAWEWMEQYGPVQIESEDLNLSHEERSRKLTQKLMQDPQTMQMEKVLKETKETALKKGEILAAGSGYGILGVRGELTSHLEFTDESGEAKRWKNFLDGGELFCPEPEKRPELFLDDKESYERLKQAVKGEESENWYAHYHLGIRYYQEGKKKKAKKEWKRSVQLKENAWALHGLSLVSLLLDKKKKAAAYILKGMDLQKEELSYQKEGFKILLEAQAFEKICRCYQNLSSEFQKNSRLKFYYIYALEKTDQIDLAYELFEEDGGLILDDLREGEDSLAELWGTLYERKFGEKAQTPYRYLFAAVE